MMKPFTKRLALVMGLLFTALICCGIVYIDNVKHYLSYLGGSVQLVVNTNQVLTVDTNSLFMSHKYPVEVRARIGAITPPFSIVDTNGATNLFLVNSNGGHRSLSVINSSFTTMPNSSDGGSINGYFDGSTNCSPNGSAGGSVNGYFSASTNCSPNVSIGASVNARFSNSTNCSPNASSGGTISARWSDSVNCSPNASTGGSVGASFAQSTNCSPNVSTGGSINASFADARNCSPVGTFGGYVQGLFQLTSNSSFSAISSTLAAYVVSTASNSWTALRGGRIFGTATNSTNIVLHSSDGSFISGRFFDNTNLRATNSATILGQPPAGTTNAASNGAMLNYGDVSIMGGGLSIGTNGANAAFVTNLLSVTATLDFGSIAAGTIQDLPVAIAGAADGDVVTVAVPLSSVTNCTWMGFASNAVVYVRAANGQLVTAQDPNSGVFRIKVEKFR